MKMKGGIYRRGMNMCLVSTSFLHILKKNVLLIPYISIECVELKLNEASSLS